MRCQWLPTYNNHYSRQLAKERVMDPLSLATGLVGLGTAVAQLSKFLTKVVRTVKDAPSQALTALTEVNETTIILSQLQSYLLKLELADRSCAALIKVDHVVILLSGCI